MKRPSIFLSSAFVCGLCLAAFAQTNIVEPVRAPITLPHPVQDKNFYFLSLLENTPQVRDAIKRDPDLARIAEGRLSALDQAANTCGTNPECYVAAFRWSTDQNAEVARALTALYRTSPALHALIDGPLNRSGMYLLEETPSDGAGPLARIWLHCAIGMNHIMDVYGLGKNGRYPAIDSASDDVKSAAYQRVIQNLVLLLHEDKASLDLFFTPSERFALELMDFNHRDEAGRFEPLETGENTAALARAKTLDWTRYPYTVIVVPGAGNETPGVALSAFGKLRDEIAVKRWKEGKAPFLLVSGGFVHPAHTEFAEAIEMKRDLMTRFGVPANAIIVDPHARHTTTNMRNAARLMYRYGIPFNKKALVTTDAGQSESIEAPAFEKRCNTELGYLPYKLLGRVSIFDLEFLPELSALQSDPLDPLDP